MLRAIKIVLHFFFVSLNFFSAPFFFGQLSAATFLLLAAIAIVTMCRGRVRAACLAHKVSSHFFRRVGKSLHCFRFDNVCVLFAPVYDIWWNSFDDFPQMLPLCATPHAYKPKLCRIENYFLRHARQTIRKNELWRHLWQ